MTTCLTCANFNFKRVKDETAKQGLGACTYQAPFIVFGALIDRDCERHLPAPDDVVARRRAFVRVPR